MSPNRPFDLDPNSPHIRPTEYWQQLADGRVQCDLCPRECKLREGQRGSCFVRANLGGVIVSTTYGRSSGFCVDPIEKKPLNHFYPGSSVLSFGTAGCNLSCKFCQNWDISKSKKMDSLASEASPQQIALMAQNQGCTSVAYTYNDPVIFQEYALDVAVACAELGIQSVAVSAGYHKPVARQVFYDHMDAANIDLKSFDENFYWRLTGSHLAPVLDTLIYISQETDVWLEVTTLLIPGHNDSHSEIERMSRWIVDNLGPNVPLHFSAFHPDYKMQTVPATPLQTLREARQIARANGINFVYTGNVHDREGDTTECANCGAVLIERDWYRLLRYEVNEAGCCGQCGKPLPGRFAAQFNSK